MNAKSASAVVHAISTGKAIALGVAGDGRKHVLGIYQADTENSASCIELLTNLESHGLPSSGLLRLVLPKFKLLH